MACAKNDARELVQACSLAVAVSDSIAPGTASAEGGCCHMAEMFLERDCGDGREDILNFGRDLLSQTIMENTTPEDASDFADFSWHLWGSRKIRDIDFDHF